MADGFLGRWSRRKLETREGVPAEPEAPAPAAKVEPTPALTPATQLPAETSAPVAADPAAPAPPPPPPTMEDVQALTHESDFRRFVTADVSPDVRNAAVKKLFTDPHYNVMDRMDVYIDDYSQPDPIPESMLRNLVSAKVLGLFREEEERKAEPADQPRDVAETPPSVSVAQSADPAPTAAMESHADPDLRLQQDDAAGGEDPGPEPGGAAPAA